MPREDPANVFSFARNEIISYRQIGHLDKHVFQSQEACKHTLLHQGNKRHIRNINRLTAED